jgi:hypothetical protein
MQQPHSKVALSAAAPDRLQSSQFRPKLPGAHSVIRRSSRTSW